VPMASRRAGTDRYDALLAAMAHAETPQDRGTILTAIASFNDPTVLRRALDASLTEAIRQADVLRLIYTASGDPVRRPVVVAWVTDHFDALRARLPGDRVGRLVGIASSACTRDEITAAEAFWAPRVGAFEAATRGLREGLEAAAQCAALRERESPRVRTFFGRVAGPGHNRPRT
jgi:alanyl aminopeptidase